MIGRESEGEGGWDLDDVHVEAEADGGADEAPVGRGGVLRGVGGRPSGGMGGDMGGSSDPCEDRSWGAQKCIYRNHRRITKCLEYFFLGAFEFRRTISRGLCFETFRHWCVCSSALIQFVLPKQSRTGDHFVCFFFSDPTFPGPARGCHTTENDVPRHTMVHRPNSPKK